MSKYESWRARQCRQKIGGLLIEDHQVIKPDRNMNIGKRHIASVVLGESNNI
jgi:hypothetical protein